MQQYTVPDVLNYVEENDIKFIRLQFCDPAGMLRNLSIMPVQLRRAFEYGISFNAADIPSFPQDGREDLRLHPDPDSLSLLPWRPQHGRVLRLLCDIRHADGSDYAGDSRAVLRRACLRLQEQGLACHIGTESTFYLFMLDEQGEPTRIPHDRAGAYSLAPRDRGENIRREICLTLEEMGIQPESSCHAAGPGQHEINFQYAGALHAADNFMTFDSVVRTIAARNGLFATFMPRPIANASPNRLHINLSLSRAGENIFRSGEPHSPQAESFVAGVLHNICKITALLNPLTNSYSRPEGEDAPAVTWGHISHGHTVRIPAPTGTGTRMEVTSADPACNPYLAFALLIEAGMEGMRKNLALHGLTVCDRLPATLPDALALAQESRLCQDTIGAELLSHLINYRMAEWEARKASSLSPLDWDIMHYFQRM